MIVEPIVYQYFNETPSIILQNGDVHTVKSFEEMFNNSNFNSGESTRASILDLENLRTQTFLKSFTGPFLIFADGFNIPQFSKIIYDTDTKNYLNKHGLCIFLTELLVKYRGERKYISKFDDIAKKLNSLNIADLRFDGNDVKCFQLDSILDLVKNNALENVTVFTIEDNVNSIFSKNYQGIKFICKDLFLSYEIKNIDTDITATADKIKKKFLCNTWRYSPYRHLLVAFLSNFDSRYGWYYRGTIDSIQNGIHFNIKDSRHYSYIQKGIVQLNFAAPINLDIKIDRAKNITGTLSDLLLLPDQKIPHLVSPDVYKDVFCAVVNECEFTEPTANFSEKILNAINYSKPFILVGAPKSLEYLRKYGFKTFEEFWDESYDQEINHKHRLEKIFDLICYIDKFNLQELEHLYNRMLPVLRHNKKILKMLSITDQWPEFT